MNPATGLRSGPLAGHRDGVMVMGMGCPVENRSRPDAAHNIFVGTFRDKLLAPHEHNPTYAF